jgi:hypothetical protein
VVTILGIAILFATIGITYVIMKECCSTCFIFKISCCCKKKTEEEAEEKDADGNSIIKNNAEPAKAQREAVDNRE